MLETQDFSHENIVEKIDDIENKMLSKIDSCDLREPVFVYKSGNLILIPIHHHHIQLQIRMKSMIKIVEAAGKRKRT